MRDVFPKFIIETDSEQGDCLIIAKCTYHKQLAYVVKNVKGGGWWTLKDNIFILSGESHDFGKAKLEDIKNCVQNKKVFTNYTLSNNLTNKYTFQYKTETDEIIDL
jgi:hypothetical protein